jgi:hypothetical protein
MKIDITVPVAKETYELGVGITKFIKACKGALEDGFEIGDDLPVIMASALGELLPAIEGVEKIKYEIVEDRAAFSNAVSLTTSALIETLVSE